MKYHLRKSEARQAILDYFITPSEVLITKQTKKSEKIHGLKAAGL